MSAQVVPLLATKHCHKCDAHKPVADFHRAPGRPDGCSVYCKQCENVRRVAAQKKYRAALTTEQQAKRRTDQFRHHVRRSFGITVEDAKALLARQHGLCANRACGREVSFDVHGREPNRAVIDHCHQTGVVRGVLCHHCNKTEGFFEKNKNLILGLVEYLERSVT